MGRAGERAVDVAVAALERGALRGLEPQLLRLHADELGGVLRDVGIVGDHGGDRLTDIANRLAREDGLQVALALDRAEPHRDRREVAEVGRGDDGVHAGQRGRLVGGDRLDARVRGRGAHDPHVQLARAVDVVDEVPGAAQQARVLAPQEGHVRPASAAWRTASRMPW